MAAYVMEFDPANSQNEYQFIAQAVSDGHFEVGFIVVDMPWYLSEDQWKYYIVKPHFTNNRMTMSLERVEVQKDTIKPYTQIYEIVYHQSIGDSVELVKIDPETSEEESLGILLPDDDVPYSLWGLVPSGNNIINNMLGNMWIEDDEPEIIESQETTEMESKEEEQPKKRKGRPKKSES